jgi:hypothetical protein
VARRSATAAHDACRAEATRQERSPASREQRRSLRKRPVRGKTICVKRVPKRELELGRISYPEVAVERPATRAECADGPRPCPFVSCQYHLYLDVLARTGNIKLNFPDLEVWEMSETCALDVADRGGTTLEDVALLMNLTRERIRQIEARCRAKLAPLWATIDDDGASGAGMGKRHLPVLGAARSGPLALGRRRSA